MARRLQKKCVHVIKSNKRAPNGRETDRLKKYISNSTGIPSVPGDLPDSIVFRLSKHSRPSLEFIQVVDEKIQPKPSARNLGVILDQSLDLTDHVNKICVSCQYHLRNIAKTRKYLSEDTSQILVHTFY